MSKSFGNSLVVICLISLFFVLGCSSSPKVDASTDKTFKESIQEIVKSIPEEGREEFQKTLTGMAMLVALAKQGNEQEVRNFFDGMTYDDIMTKAQELRDKMKGKK